mgnify:FL=1
MLLNLETGKRVIDLKSNSQFPYNSISNIKECKPQIAQKL